MHSFLLLAPRYSLNFMKIFTKQLQFVFFLIFAAIFAQMSTSFTLVHCTEMSKFKLPDSPTYSRHNYDACLFNSSIFINAVCNKHTLLFFEKSTFSSFHTNGTVTLSTTFHYNRWSRGYSLNRLIINASLFQIQADLHFIFTILPHEL